MATYVVTTGPADEYPADPNTHFKLKPPAVEKFQHLAATGVPVRLVRWENDTPTVIERANDRD